MKLNQFIKEVKQTINEEFSDLFLDNLNDLEKTSEAMNYMINLGDGGKRIRSSIVVAITKSFGGDESLGWELAKSVELIHTYTLIIDDIQDNDKIRRGNPTCHTKFGFNTAILAANRLFELGAASFHKYPEQSPTFSELNSQLHKGQAADLESENWDKEKYTLENLQFIHAGKTSSLIQMSILGGCIAAKIKGEEMEKLLNYGYYAGLAFQARDDILSQIKTSEDIGKPAGEGVDETKLTYPNLFGDINKAIEENKTLGKLAIEYLSDFPEEKVKILIELADFAVNRSK